MKNTLLGIAFSLGMLPVLSVAAEDGKANYMLYCSACHGEDGVGPKNNPNPPLSKSEWLLGKPDRAISAVISGLTGPIEVKGKLYNLIMPPQGALLSDEKIASILTHVRKSYGNKGKEVKAEEVAKVRAGLAERKTPFTSGELRKKHPIPYGRGWPRIKNLISSVYEGKWESMPDFSQMEPVSVEEETRNLVDVAHAAREKEFGIVWEGGIMTQREGDYNAMLDASDGAILYINGQKIVEVTGIGPRGSERARRRRFRMKKGSNPFRLEYHNNQGNPGLSFKMSGPTGAPWLSESRLEIQPTAPPVMLTAEKGSAVLYRNFIKGARPKAIGVGYDGGVNQAFSIEHLGLDLIWQGDFIDGGKHWTNRGQGFQKPAGKDVVQLLTRPAYAQISAPDTVWPNRGEGELVTRYRGYGLDAQGLPSFRYNVGDLQVEERSSYQEKDGKRLLERRIEFVGKAPENLHLALTIGPNMKVTEAGFLLDDKVALGVTSSEEITPVIRGSEKPELVLPIKFAGERALVVVTYLFP